MEKCLFGFIQRNANEKLYYFFALSFVLLGIQHAEAKRVLELRIGKGEARIDFLEGSAQVLPAGKKAWRYLRVGDKPKEGDEVNKRSKARLELVLPDYYAVRFAGNTHFKILQMEAGDEAIPVNIRFHLALGKTWANVSRLMGKGSQFELQCENVIAGAEPRAFFG